jgi:hypothetical protein
MMNLRSLMLPLTCSALLSLSACSDEQAPGATGSSRAGVTPADTAQVTTAGTTSAAMAAGAAGKAASTAPAVPKELADFQIELLDVAYAAASKMPTMPHIKNRCRAQEEVVDACLELGQPRLALGYVERIDNWRRGVGYADVAYWYAQHDRTVDVQPWLDLARKASEHSDDENAQDWQRDRIRAGIARTLVVLGQGEQANEFSRDLADSEAGRVQSARARVLDEAGFDQQLADVDAVVKAQGFDQIRNALEACAQLFDRFYADAGRRQRVEDKIKASWSKLPPEVRVELLAELSESALAHDDRAEAGALAGEARALIEASHWTRDLRVKTLARAAALLHRAGDVAQARQEADAARALYDSEREKIVDIDRADTLRPLAEAYQAMGDAKGALAVYKRAVEEGGGNINSRPRADDLVATCCSMAMHGVEPDAALRARILQVRDGLGDPW